MHVYAHVEIVSTARNPYTGPGCPWIDLRGPIDNNTRRHRARKQIETCCTDMACHCARYQKFGRREVPAEDESRTRADGERGMRRARATRPGSAGHARALHYIMSRDASSGITLPRRRRVTSRGPPSRPLFAFCSPSVSLSFLCITPGGPSHCAYLYLLSPLIRVSSLLSGSCIIHNDL